MLIRRNGLLFITLLIQSTHYAQLLDLEYYSTREGLVSHGVNAIYQDPLGRLWIATGDGLSIYDGSEFRNYRTVDGLPIDAITSIAGCGESPTAAWIGTFGGGVCKIDNDRLTVFRLAPTGPSNVINTLLEDGDGRLWIGTPAGLFVLSKGMITPHSFDDEEQGISGIAETTDGVLLIARERSVAVLRTNKPPYHLDLGLNEQHFVTSMHVDARGLIWLGTSDGIIVRCSVEGVIDRARISRTRLQDITEDRKGFLWICSEDGLFLLDKQFFGKRQAARFGKENGFLGEFFFCALFDREENLWIGGLGQGIYKLRDRALVKFPLIPVLPGHYYNYAAVGDEAGRIWSFDGESLLEIRRHPSSGWARTRHRLRGGHIKCVQSGKDNTLLVGFVSGDIHVYRVGNIQRHLLRTSEMVKVLRPGFELPNEAWMFFVYDSRGEIWLSVPSVGVVVLQGDSYKRTTLTREDGIPFEDVRAIREDVAGNMWIGGLDGGIAVFNKVENRYLLIRRFVSGNGLDDDRVRSIHFDRLGRCWVGTRHGGITMTDGNTWRSLTTRDGLLSNAVMSITEESSGTMWIGTPLGLQGIDVDSFRVKQTIPAVVGESVSSCGFAEGLLWAYTTKALIVYDMRHATPDPIPPLISIRDLRVNGTPRAGKGLLELSHNENNISVSYAGISLRNEKGVQYQYRLRDVEAEWGSASPSRSVTYASLQPGKYTFEVRAINSEGVTSAMPASVSFTVLPPVWQRWWFQLGAALLVAAILWMIHKNRIAKLLELERTRLRIARDLHDEIGSTLSSISFFAQAVRSARTESNGGNTERLISLIAESSSKAKSAISDIIWAIDPSNDDWDELMARMRRYASDICESRGIRYHIDLPTHIGNRPPSMQERRNLWLLFKEVIANAAQHSRCSRIGVKMNRTNDVITLVVADDGVGFDEDQPMKGTGLKSIRDRGKALGATIQLETGAGRGTRWLLQWRV